MTPSKGSAKAALPSKLHGLDTLRVLAIILVFLFHYSHLFPHPAWTETAGKFGWSGVDLFFTLSGYLIASQLFLSVAITGRVPLKTFFTKRFFRIIPAYATVVALYFLFPFVREREAPAALWRYLSFTQNLGLDLRYEGTFSHAWSLCIEEQFYLCLPLILAALVYYKVFKKGIYVLLFFFLFCFASRLFSWYHFVVPYLEQENAAIQWYKWIYYPTYCRLDGLLIGVSVAALYQFRPAVKEKMARRGNLLLLAGLLLLTGAYFVCREERSFQASVFGFPLVDLGYGLLVCGAVSPSSVLYRFQSTWITRLAVLSYAVYLVHKITIHLTQPYFAELGVEMDSNLMLLLCMLTSLLGAALLYVLIEKPFLRIRNRLLSAGGKPAPGNMVPPEQADVA